MRTGETEMGGPDPAFQPTLWTDVLKARAGARDALGRLIGAYWRPVYWFVRRRGNSVEDAKDLVQDFFARLLDRDGLAGTDRVRGRFRSYLLGAVEHFLSDERDRRKAKKRTPGDFDFGAAEKHFRADVSFERDWAIAVLERAMTRLRAESPKEADAAAAMRAGTPYAELASRLGTTEGNVKVLAHRARTRLRSLLLQELRATVATPAEAEAELAGLFRALSP